MIKILIVEDDPSIRLGLRAACQREGFGTFEAGTGEEALASVRRDLPDLVLLDLMLPDTNGLDVCREIRREENPVPIIMLTARGDEIDRVVGLEVGADDYVGKPFSPRELIARIRAVLRRTQIGRASAGLGKASLAAPLRFGDLTVMLAEREVLVGDDRVSLTPTEFDLLAYLAVNPNIALTREQMLTQIWGYDTEGDTRLLDSHVAHLRAKVERDPSRPRHILTVRNIGYKLLAQPD